MGITNIGATYYSQMNNNYRVNPIPVVKNDSVSGLSQNNQVDLKDESKQSERKYDISPISRQKASIDPKDVSLSFNKGNDYSYIGSDKDIAGLDIEKAISDMKQDRILQEYNYFVGNSNNVFSSEDGVVLAK